MHVLERCSLAPLTASARGQLFAKLLDHFSFYMGFEISDHVIDSLLLRGLPPSTFSLSLHALQAVKDLHG